MGKVKHESSTPPPPRLPPPMPGSAAKPNELDEDEEDGIKMMNLEDSESEQEACAEEGHLLVEDDNDISEGGDNQRNSILGLKL